MDIQLYVLFTAVGFLAAIVAFMFKSKGIGGIAAIVFILTGLAMLNTGISTALVYQTVNNVTALDTYTTYYNTTYNFSYISNVSSAIGKTFTQTYTYTNLWSDYTNLFAIMLIAVGAIVGFEAMWRS